MRALLFGGDKLSSAPEEALPFQAVNHYGPTEDTVVATCCQMMSAAAADCVSPPIGKPIANNTVYVLNQFCAPVPVGTAGELYIGGTGLARGYISAPAATAERFLPTDLTGRAGDRLYRTGDQVRYLVDGNLEFLERIDSQVKIRGYRIELAEIEAVLSSHPAVRQAAVIVHERENGERQLVACITANLEALEYSRDVSEDQVRQWQDLYDETYRKPAVNDNNDTFNLIGWNNSYTGAPFSDDEMREWLDHTVNRVRALRPRHVLEIGCGTGLILFRLASDCERYVGTDFSKVAISELSHRLKSRRQKIDGVTLMQRSAVEFDGFAAEEFDTVILNSVAQYFPNIDYLVDVLRQAMRVVKPGGHIFVGDIRNQRLLDAFHMSLVLSQKNVNSSPEEMRDELIRRVESEKELVIDPDFFHAFKERCPGIASVDVEIKQGVHDNELTRFRYDVILRVGLATKPSVGRLLDWPASEISVAGLRTVLQQAQCSVGLRRIPNSRVADLVKAVKMVGDHQVPGLPEKELEYAVAGTDKVRFPWDFWNCAMGLPYDVHIYWSEAPYNDCCDIWFEHEPASDEGCCEPRPHAVVDLNKPWAAYATDPLKRLRLVEMEKQLRVLAREKLPNYMVPVSFVLLDTLPQTTNGKTDRKSLDAMFSSRHSATKIEDAARTPIESLLAWLWSDVLAVTQVGIHDNFFELGGHSILSTQLVSRIREIFQLELPLRTIFEAPTIASLAKEMLKDPGDKSRIEKTAEIMLNVANLSESAVSSMLSARSAMPKPAEEPMHAAD
jgi:acyl-CoA synthetase (AMP-forming)/AMP-acid ligase II